MIIANHGVNAVSLKQVRFDGFEEANACTLDEGGSGGRGGGPGRGAAAPATTPVSVLRKDQIASCDVTLTVPADARTTEPYWHRAGDAGRDTFDEDAPFGAPNRPTPFYAQVTFGFTGKNVFHGLPIHIRYEGSAIVGEKRSELLVVLACILGARHSGDRGVLADAARGPGACATGDHDPGPGGVPTATAGRGVAAAGRGTPAPAGRGTPPAGRGAAAAGRGAPATPPPPPPPPPLVTREVRVTVANGLSGPSESVVRLELPEGWAAAPAQQAITFTREDESQTVRFQISAPSNAKPGDYHLKAIVNAGEVPNQRGFQTVEYPHIRRQHIYRDASVQLKLLDVRTSPNLTVGYIMGAGDDVPRAIQQLGAKIELLGNDDLAWGDLGRFGTIVTGVRANETRQGSHREQQPAD